MVTARFEAMRPVTAGTEAIYLVFRYVWRNFEMLRINIAPRTSRLNLLREIALTR